MPWGNNSWVVVKGGRQGPLPAGSVPGGGGHRGGPGGAGSDPAGGEGLHVAQALEQVHARGRDRIAVAAVVQQAGLAQFLDARVEGVGRDAAHAVLQQPERLRMAVAQGPEHAQRITAFELLEKLVDGGVFLGTHGGFSLRKGGARLAGRMGTRAPRKYSLEIRLLQV